MQSSKLLVTFLLLGADACVTTDYEVDSSTLVGVDEAGDHFGRTSVVADFDGDGLSDLAVGTPWEHNVNGVQTGAVYLYRGTANGLVAWHTLVPPQPDGVSRFGLALAAGDIDGDGIAELVVGAPNANLGSLTAAGKVWVYQGLATWPWLSKSITRPNAAADDEFGSALAVGNFIATTTANGVRKHNMEIMVGVSERSTLEAYQYSAPIAADDFAHATFQRQGMISLGTSAGNYGTALAVGNIDGDAYDDIASSAPGVGRVYVLYGSSTGVFTGGSTVVSDPGSDDGNYGAALAMGKFDGTSRSQLVVGAPDRDNGRGRAYVFSYTLTSNSYPLLRTLSPLEFTFDPTSGGFGSSLACGRVDSTVNDHIVVGAPYAESDAGRIALYRVGGTGFLAGNSWGDRDGLDGNAHYGISISIGHFNTSSTQPHDIAVGQPNRDSGAGALWILHGHTGGPTYNPATLTTFLQQSS